MSGTSIFLSMREREREIFGQYFDSGNWQDIAEDWRPKEQQEINNFWYVL